MTMRFAGVEPPRRTHTAGAAPRASDGEPRDDAGTSEPALRGDRRAAQRAERPHEDANMIGAVHRQQRSWIYGAMEFSVPRRQSLFADDPVAELRGLGTLTDPDDDVAAVIDLAVIGARGD